MKAQAHVSRQQVAARVPTRRVTLLTATFAGVLLATSLALLATVVFVVVNTRPLSDVDLGGGLAHQFPADLPRHLPLRTAAPQVDDASRRPPRRAEVLRVDLSPTFDAEGMSVEAGPDGMLILGQSRQKDFYDMVPIGLLDEDGTPVVSDQMRLHLSGEVLLPDAVDERRATQAAVSCYGTDTSRYLIALTARKAWVNVYEPGESRVSRTLAPDTELPRPGPGWHDVDVICNGATGRGTRVRVWVDERLVIDELDRASESRPWQGQLRLGVLSDELVQRQVAFRELTVGRPR